jgi:AraC-like DNA-binding protein
MGLANRPDCHQGFCMPTWSTDTLPAADRFPYWREVRARNLFGVSAELDQSRHSTFHGVFSAEPVASATLIEMHASPYAVTRTKADIERAPSASLCIYQQMRGGAWFSAAGNTEFTVAAGAVAISHSDLPYATRPTTGDGFHLRILKIPFAICAPYLRRQGDLSPLPVHNELRMNALLSFYFTTFLAQAPHLHDDDAGTGVSALALLALAVRGRVANYEEPMRSAVREARLTCARELIGQNFQRPELSPSIVAVMLGVSVRQLHLLFEPTGVSFARTLTLRRLDQARSLLVQFAGRPVAAIAFSSGFDSLATFYRVFRSTFGMSPTDYRQSVVPEK